MTVTVYTAKFVSADNSGYAGGISWDKYTAKTLNATLCQFTGPNEVGYPVWQDSRPYGPAGMQDLVKALKAEAETMGLTLVSEGETKFAVR